MLGLYKCFVFAGLVTFMVTFKMDVGLLFWSIGHRRSRLYLYNFYYHIKYQHVEDKADINQKDLQIIDHYSAKSE